MVVRISRDVVVVVADVWLEGSDGFVVEGA